MNVVLLILIQVFENDQMFGATPINQPIKVKDKCVQDRAFFRFSDNSFGSSVLVIMETI